MGILYVPLRGPTPLRPTKHGPLGGDEPPKLVLLGSIPRSCANPESANGKPPAFEAEDVGSTPTSGTRSEVLVVDGMALNHVAEVRILPSEPSVRSVQW